MANTLTNLYRDIYTALDHVSREQVGFIPAVNRDSGVERAAVGDTVRVPIVPASTASDITPGVTAPDDGDAVITNVTLSITKAREVGVRFTGEETKALENSGTYGGIVQDRFEQAFRTLCNEVETDLASLYTKASRAYGTAGTTPFATIDELDDASETMRILEDNGAPSSDLHMVCGSAAIAKLRGFQGVLFKANEAGTDDMLRRGIVGGLMGFKVHNSRQVASHTKGTATGYDANGGEPAGETTIVVDGSDSGTILAGDVITFAGDSSKYVVQSATASGAATGNIVIAEPGLQSVLATTVEGTTGANYTANMAFHRGAIQLATRIPALPDGGDSADDRMTIQDPVSGLAFEVAIYRQYRQIRYEVSLAWGYELTKPEHTAILLG